MLVLGIVEDLARSVFDSDFAALHSHYVTVLARFLLLRAVYAPLHLHSTFFALLTSIISD